MSHCFDNDFPSFVHPGCKPRDNRMLPKNNLMKTLTSLVIVVFMLTACGRSHTKNDTVMKPIELTKSEFLQKVVNYETTPNEWKYLGEKPALIDFYATWCGPCKMVAPILDELAAEYGDSIVIYKINTEKESELAAVFGIRSIPSLLFVPKDGKPQMIQGAMGKADLKQAIDQILLNR